MAPSASYDPNSPNEEPLPIPEERIIEIVPGVTLFPPRTRRGRGPGLIAFLSPHEPEESRNGPAPLDPVPCIKWAEEGFAVLAATVNGGGHAITAEKALEVGVEALLESEDVDNKNQIGIVVYDHSVLDKVIEQGAQNDRIGCIVSYGGTTGLDTSIPILAHLPSGSAPLNSTTENRMYHVYATPSPSFADPDKRGYHGPSAALAHTRSLVFLRKHLNGPNFDIEKIWEEHCYYEFEVRSVAKTMSTMVPSPYVNHVPTMIGGVGKEKLTAFYRDHFIFSNPPDVALETVSRTIGADRIIDEFIFSFTHDRIVNWLLPGVPPTNKKLHVPMVGVVNIRGDRLYHEHIWWDQAGALLQAGILPTHVPQGDKSLRLPVSGAEAAHLLANETGREMNDMLGPEWGLRSSLDTTH